MLVVEMMDGDKPRVGVVVPGGNAAVESELRFLLGETANLYASRYPVFSDYELRERLRQYMRSLPATAAGFGRLRLDAVVAACSGNHYLQGPVDDARTCTALSEKLGTPFCSVTQAVLRYLAHQQIDRVVLASPYGPWLTELSENYWRAAGIGVDAVAPIASSCGYSPYDVVPQDIFDSLSEASIPDDSTVLFTGTGMFTLDAIRALRRRRGWRCVTSNISCAWWALRTVGVADLDATGEWPFTAIKRDEVPVG
jgi:maleate cis-trans isomerase